MKNHLIISLLILSVGFSQKLTEVVETYENGNIKSITYHKKSRTGIEKVKYEQYYEYGQKKIEETWKDGKKERLKTRWYENGQKWFEETWKDGWEDGLWTWWYENGQKNKEGTYKDGKMDGLWTRWYENGQNKTETTFKDGKGNGLATSWHENGQKRNEATFKDGELISAECWDEDGNEKECD